MELDWAYPAKRWVFSGPTSIAMESSGWYFEKKGETQRDVETNCGKGLQGSKQNLVWYETTGPVKSSVKSWHCWWPISRTESRKLRREEEYDKIEPGLYIIIVSQLTNLCGLRSTITLQQTSPLSGNIRHKFIRRMDISTRHMKHMSCSKYIIIFKQ